ncbi:related to cytochrome P450 monooxygenase [Cephalotrichum gorgonifer]|uniref:Related to cytochrome P450 monooxygenase n=1 Tax=Cephalotrichum gorgonifer TaxID=2041049 RepID=A0AAE8N6M5_9PEZI|nr:related to cytochrome P450 monooxygenase [Cephalotrichum gorgonifer]
MHLLATALFAAVPILVIKGVLSLRHQRLVRYKDFPQLKPSVIWGHLAAVGEEMNKVLKDTQWDTIAGNMFKSIGNPPLLLLDLRPLNFPMAIIADHELAEQVSRASKLFPYSVPKSSNMSYIDPLVGHHSLVSIQGDHWRALRRRFNPGFAPQYLLNLLPGIIEKIPPFLAHLDRLASTEEAAELGTYTTSLTFDVIGMTTMDKDLSAQKPRGERSELINLYGDLLDSYNALEDSPVANWLIHPITVYQQKQMGKKIDLLIKDVVRAKHAEIAADASRASRSVLSLSLQDVADLTPDVLQQTCDSMKTFLFAGHDTASIVLQWSFYELERSPRAAAALCAELDALFGPDPDPEVVMGVLRERGDEVLSKMTYATAFIKEILRLYPPGGSARHSPPGSGFFVTTADGKSYCLDGMMIYLCATLIQRDPAVYGPTADEFIPERWLGDVDGGAGPDGEREKTGSGGGSSSIPASAWRPFERGPRNCIGQELASIESKIVLACVARRYEFIKTGLGAIKRDEAGERVVEGGKCVTESELYSSRRVTAKPVDGMVSRVAFKAGAKPRG